MNELFITLVPYMVLFSHLVLVFAFVAILARATWGREVYEFLGRNALVLGFLVALGAMLGSLYYSEIVGFEACVLCWWQRGFLYPIVLVFGVGFWRKKDYLFPLASVLALGALLVGGYQEISNLTGASLLACTDTEGACAKVFVKEFGYITIPVMSVTVSLYVILLAWVNKLFKQRNG